MQDEVEQKLPKDDSPPPEASQSVHQVCQTRQLPRRYGRNTPVTAPGPASVDMLRNLRNILEQPVSYLEKVWRSCGDVVQFPIPAPTYLVSSPHGAREVLIHSHPFVGKRTLQYDTLALVTGNGLLTADTDQWRPRRRMLQPAFHHDLVMLSERNIDAALAELDEQWLALTEDGDAIVDVDQAMMSLALRITGSTLFGADLSVQVERLTHATLEALDGVMRKAKNPLTLPLGLPTPKNLRMRKAIAVLNAAVDDMVATRRNNMLDAGLPIRDLLDILVCPENNLSDQQIRDEIVTFIVAGHETVASAMTWAWYLLGQAPDEVQAIRSDQQRATHIFDEVLRLYPPAWIITRRALADLVIDGYVIPKDSLIIVSPWLVHRHPSIWQSPEVFDPDRFRSGVPIVGYLPFGTGSRICIGREMARFEGAMVLRSIVQRWNITPVHNAKVPLDASVTLRPKSGLPMKISRAIQH